MMMGLIYIRCPVRNVLGVKVCCMLMGLIYIWCLIRNFVGVKVLKRQYAAPAAAQFKCQFPAPPIPGEHCFILQRKYCLHALENTFSMTTTTNIGLQRRTSRTTSWTTLSSEGSFLLLFVEQLTRRSALQESSILWKKIQPTVYSVDYVTMHSSS